MTCPAPHLSPRLIAKPLEDLRAWSPSLEDDLLHLHRGVLRALVATDALTRLELPCVMRAPRLDDQHEIAHWDTICALLDQAVRELVGPVHAERVERLRVLSPGHALELSRLGAEAVERLQALRVRVDFVCGGDGLPATRPAHEPLAMTGTLQ
jgi:hypothetical protein